jgi:two-component system, OmpR family, sensor kinase
MRMPLKTRLTLLYLTLFAVIVAAWSVGVIALVRADLYAGIDRALDSRASQVALSLNGSGEGEFQDITSSTLVGVAPTEATAQLLSSTGAVLESSGDTMSVDPILAPPVVAEALRSGAASIHTVTDQGGESFRALIVRLPDSDRLIVVGTSTESADASVQRLILIMLLSGPLALLGAAVAGWLLASRALAPVAHMTAIADGIGIEALERRVPVPAGRDELSALATTLNGMLDRLEQGVRAKRRLVADASHELQTPLAVMRTELDVRLASGTLPAEAVEVLESAREETDRMARIVRNLLTLARFDEGTLRLLPAPLDLADVAAEAVESLSVLARENGVSVSVSGGSVEALADPEYLRTAVVNLVENAIKYSGRGGLVVVATGSDARSARLIVSDTGPGIPEADLTLIFERFYRADDARTTAAGSGLGLSIAREIAEAHEGTLAVESESGRGSTFTLSLPRPASS